MKKFIYILSIFSFITLTSCDKTSEDPSKITYFVTFEMNGDATTLVPIGTTFTDPGVKAMEGETDVTSSVTIKGSVNPNEIGLYTLSYSVSNVDGFSSAVERTVIVYNPDIETDISGNYTVAEGSYRLWMSSGAKVAFAGYPVNIIKIASGVFSVSDFFGGYYDKRAAYGANYAMTGYIKINEDNTIDELSSFIKGWSDYTSLNSLDNAVYDPETNSISFESDYNGGANHMIFFITLTK